jgi:hypothetical protein
MNDPDYAEVIKEACSKDFLFWLAGFVWTYDPRPHVPFPKIPFIPYKFQEEASLEILWSMGVEDALIEKSRDMGASWLLVAIFTWMFLYRRDQSFLFVSRVEQYVDQSGNPKSLFWKVDFIIDNLPEWLRPKGYNPNVHRTKMHIESPETNSVIDGEATTGQVARGDRRTAILLDEFAAVDEVKPGTGRKVLSSTRDATNCRIFNSTPAGTGNSFYEVRESKIKKIRMHWSEHPRKSKGLYTTDEDGLIKILDPAGWKEIHEELRQTTWRFGKEVELDPFEPILDGKLRSPWYDGECGRTVSEQEIAQELDIDYLGSGFQFFNAERIQDAINRHCIPAFCRGDLEYDYETCDPIAFVEHPQGCLELWCLLDSDGNPIIDGRNTIGCDISAGTGASNSAASIWANKTQEKIAQYTNPRIRPEQFAKYAVALAKWFGDAHLIWESNGVGRQFGAAVMDLHYGDIYYRRKDDSIGKKISDVPGWASSKEAKIVLLGAYRASVEQDKSINKSKESMEETLEYVFAPDGSVVHSRSSSKHDPSGAKTNHGDRVIADALAVKGMGERKRTPTQDKPKIPVGSLAWRNQMREDMKQTIPNRELGREWG